MRRLRSGDRVPGVWSAGGQLAVSSCNQSLHCVPLANDRPCQIREQRRSEPVTTRVGWGFPQTYPHVLCITRPGGGHRGNKGLDGFWQTCRSRKTCACSGSYPHRRGLLHRATNPCASTGCDRFCKRCTGSCGQVALARKRPLSRSIRCGYSWRLVLDTARCGRLRCSVPYGVSASN